VIRQNRTAQDLAVHEAAHAAMAYRYRSLIGNRGVWIRGNRGGEANVPTLASSREGWRLTHHTPEWKAWASRARAEVISLLAGPIAEWIYAGARRVPLLSDPEEVRRDPRGDMVRAERLISALAGPSGYLALQGSLQVATRRILTGVETWPAIIAVAGALVRRGQMTGPEVFRVFEKHGVPKIQKLFVSGRPIFPCKWSPNTQRRAIVPQLPRGVIEIPRPSAEAV
jgi:hypothetical protein